MYISPEPSTSQQEPSSPRDARSDDASLQNEAQPARGPSTGALEGETIEVRVPPRAEYMPVLRAAAGLIAGSMSFNHDEIVRIRTALAQAFEPSVAALTPHEQRTASISVVATFAVQPDRTGIKILDLKNGISHMSPEAGEENRPLIESPIDESELWSGADGKSVITLVLHKSSEELPGVPPANGPTPPTTGAGMRPGVIPNCRGGSRPVAND